jgi:hypothetical protein
MKARKQRVYVGKGLTRKAAFAAACKKAKRDWRGMSYSAKTGWAVLV